MAKKSQQQLIEELKGKVELMGNETYQELVAFGNKYLPKELKTEDAKPEMMSMDNVMQDMKKVEGTGVKVRRPQPNSSAANQLNYFAKQDKVRYRLPKSPGEKDGVFETVIVNDLMITIVRGVSVNLPEDIAKYLDDSQSITDNALNRDSLKSFPEQLSV